ncbi:MAG: glycosyltransferase [Isosphaeraceae bacterium]
MESPGREPIVILLPVFNDWPSLSALLPKLDRALAGSGRRADVLVVNDGSTRAPSPGQVPGPFRSLGRVELLNLRRNLGHQRAIAVGLAYLEDRIGPETVVVMDADGEDDPDDVPRLLNRLEAEGGRSIVFAERARRSESWKFRFFYTLYKGIHRILTGQGVKVGNFSAIPRARLASLVVVSELWNHYAAAAFRSRQPYVLVPTRRAKRLDGHSSMNFVSLVVHGLSAMAVYSDVIGVRLLMMAVVLGLLSVAGLVGSLAIRLATPWLIPGWAPFIAGISLVLLVQAVMLALNFSFTILGSRNGATVIPRRDFALFLGTVEPLGPAE